MDNSAMAKGISIKNSHPRSQQKSLLLRRLRAGRDRQGVATSVRSLTDNVFREFGSITRWSRGRVDRNIFNFLEQIHRLELNTMSRNRYNVSNHFQL